jgi:SAM-dependent methyltransferase
LTEPVQFIKYDFNHIYEQNVIKWINGREVTSERFFLITKDIYDLETYLSSHIVGYKHKVDGAGDSYNLNVLRDSMLDTRRYEYPYVRLNIPKSAESILDIGGGNTSFCFYMSERCRDYTILDIDNHLVYELATVQFNTTKFKNVTFKLGSALEIPYPDNSFDASLCVSVLEHVGKADAVIKTIEEMKRVTKSGGTIILTFDVRVNPSKEIDVEDVKKVAKHFNLKIEDMEMLRTTFKVIDSEVFTVACLTMGVEK